MENAEKEGRARCSAPQGQNSEMAKPEWEDEEHFKLPPANTITRSSREVNEDVAYELYSQVTFTEGYTLTKDGSYGVTQEDESKELITQ